MSDNSEDRDEESTDDLWAEVEAFAEAEPTDSEEFIEATPTESNSETITEADSTHTESEAFTGVDPARTDEDSQLSADEETPDADEVFDEMGVDEIDGEALWDELAGAEAEARSFDAEEATEPTEEIDTDEPRGSVSSPDEGAAERVDSTPRDTETVVDKRSYCQQCPFFADPPEVHCTHEGTEIIEVLRDGRFRLSNCPVVTDSGPDRTILNDEH